MDRRVNQDNDRVALLERQLDMLRFGSVVLTQDSDGEPINAAFKDPMGTWALGGLPDPWSSEKLALGIEVADASLWVLVAR
jgi:hypothetical protein